MARSVNFVARVMSFRNAPRHDSRMRAVRLQAGIRQVHSQVARIEEISMRTITKTLLALTALTLQTSLPVAAGEEHAVRAIEKI